MLSKWIITFLSWATKILTFMFLARLKLITNLFTSKVLYFFYFFRSHDQLFKMFWIVYLVTFNHSLVFTTYAELLD